MHVLDLGEIHDSQKEAWWRSTEVLKNDRELPRRVSLCPEDRPVESTEHDVIHVRVNEIHLERLRQWLCFRNIVQPRPATANLDRDYPDRTTKPVDNPYGPYADPFPIEQHRLGPFKPIEAFDAKLKAGK